MSDNFDDIILEPEIVCQYSFRYYIPHFLFMGSIISYYYFLLSKITSGVKIKYFFTIPQLQPLLVILFFKLAFLSYQIYKDSHIKSYLLSLSFFGVIGALAYYIFPSYIIEKSHISLYLNSWIYIFIGIIAYYVLLVKTSRIEVQGKDIIEYFGVFARTNDPTDLSWVKDKNYTRNPLERIIGTGTLALSLTKEDEKGRKVVIFNKISHENGLKIQRFFRANAFDSYREQRRVENLMKRKQNKNREDYIGDDEFNDELDK